MIIMGHFMSSIDLDLHRIGASKFLDTSPREKGPRCLHTRLLSSMSALFPTSTLLTLSEACCSMLRIQFLISEIGIRWKNIPNEKAFEEKNTYLKILNQSNK